ncbi:hypothetical protein HFN06_15175 [Rhizobium leguminosarum]|nr:hypothetical protein [Rhizobium leguminosarum]MBY5381422.1 hypothetical protein [Rhizobium leguminosarum]MCA2432794.1 hypothetical protein [Rhizobium leguminosarum]NEH74741.1 hypothetical protein [Rhizobium leguminosarum]TBG74406.1 hypothetical protein ELG69_29135 [Rhizobium leguminosarum]
MDQRGSLLRYNLELEISSYANHRACRRQGVTGLQHLRRRGSERPVALRRLIKGNFMTKTNAPAGDPTPVPDAEDETNLPPTEAPEDPGIPFDQRWNRMGIAPRLVTITIKFAAAFERLFLWRIRCH